jgi:hypothetical protein
MYAMTIASWMETAMHVNKQMLLVQQCQFVTNGVMTRLYCTPDTVLLYCHVLCYCSTLYYTLLYSTVSCERSGWLGRAPSFVGLKDAMPW